MEELFALQRQLQELQEATQINKLSDRIIVDLVDKLIREYDLKVYHTSDGQTLMTPTQLSTEILDLIIRHQRIALNQLPALIGVSMDRIEQQIQKDSNQWEVTRLQDEIFSNNYLQEMREEINEELQAKQNLQFSEIMQKYKLPVQFFKSRILAAVGTLIQGVVIDDKITTSSYVEMQTAKLRGLLRASLRPVVLSQLAKEYDIEMANKLCEQLINSVQLDGKIISGSYFPSRFIQNQESITTKYFNQNNYVEYNMLQEQLSIQKPKEFLKGLFNNNVILLQTCGFNKFHMQSIEDQITELLKSEGYTNLIDIFPAFLSEQDIETLFELIRLENTEYENSFIFSKAHLDKLSLLFKDKLIQLIFATPQKLIEQQNIVEDQNIQASAGGFANKKKAAKKPQKQTQQKNEIFTQKEVFDHLTSTNVLEHTDCVPELYQFLIPRINTLYEQVKVELFENKKTAATQLIQELQKKIEDITLSLLITQRSLHKVIEQHQQVDTKILIDNCLFGYRLLVENLVIITCKKFNIQLPLNLFIENKKDVIDCGMQTATRVFKNKDALQEAIILLPKEQAKVLREVMELYAKKQLAELLKHNFLEYFNVRVQLDKKMDKNFLYFVKHSCKEVIKSSDSNDVIFHQIVVAMLSEQGCYFVGNYDAKFKSLLTQILYESSNGTQQKLLMHISSQLQQKQDVSAEIQELLKLIKLL